MEHIIRTENLVYEYRREEDEILIRAVDHVSLEIPQGSFVAVIGRNGSGKSTIAKNFNGLLLPSGGAVYVGGLDTRKEEDIWQIRQMAGMVFQNPDNQLVSAIVEDDVAFGPENLGVEPGEIRRRVDDSLKAVHMYEERKKAPHLLSGGQKQRVAIAGVVAMRPRCIILDEPTAMLDPKGRQEVMDIVEEFHKEGITILLITHFMEEAAQADRVIIMDGGKVVMDGTPEEVFAREEEVRALSLSVPFPVKLAGRLRSRGAKIPTSIITEEALADYLLENRGKLDCSGPAPYRPDQIRFARMEQEENALIQVRNLTHVYSEGMPYETKSLDDVSVNISEGSFVGIIGHTGSGKSTLIQQLNGILKPKSGTILVDGVEITDPKTHLREIRKKVGLVFQYPEYQLFEETVEKDIAFGPRNLGLSEEEVAERVKEALELVGLDYEQYAERSPFDLSGGQKRRVAIAGVVAMRPKVLILDEPTAGLDPLSKRSVLAMIQNLRHKEGMTILLVSHNMGDIGIMADQVLVMEKGHLVMNGTPEEVFAKTEELRALRLGLPPATEFMDLLKKKGATITENPLTLWQAEDTLCKWLEEGRKAGNAAEQVPVGTEEGGRC